MVHSESVEELSDTPDHPLSASDPLSSPATITTSTPLLSAVAPPFSWYTPWGKREFVFCQLLEIGVLCNLARRNTQRLTCCCSPRSLWAEAESIEEVLNSKRSNETTFVKLNPISFPGINAPQGLIRSPHGPKNVARQVNAVHCIPEDISELVSFLILLPRGGKSIPTFGSAPIHLDVQELPMDPGSQPPASV